jgi:leucyl aminopeptidase (aminopeptidase T)
MNVTPGLLSALNGGMLNRMMPASRLHIGSTSGTDLDVEIDSSRYRWVSNRGVRKDGAFLVLPPGEVSTYPANVNGILVADGAFNLNAYTAADARLAGRPVTIEIENGRVVHASCDDPRLTRLVARCRAMDNGDRIGELGFGTNVGTTGFIPMNSHINERHPGVHLGLGQHGQPAEAVPYRSDIHLDLITSDSVVTVDGRTRIDSRELERFARERHPEPLAGRIHGEDIDGDCCGLVATEPARAGNEVLRIRQCR